MVKDNLNAHLFGVIIAITGAFSLILGVAFVKVSPWELLLQSFGTSLLCIGLLEVTYKLFVHKSHLKALEVLFKKAISHPIREVFLRREEMPSTYSWKNLLSATKEKIIIKSISYDISLTNGFFDDLEEALIQKPSLSIELGYLNPKSPIIKQIIQIGGVEKEVTKANILGTQKAIDKLSLKYPERVSSFQYSTFPTCSTIIIDPDRVDGWLKFEFYSYVNQKPKDRLQVIIDKRQDVAWFEKTYKSIYS